MTTQPPGSPPPFTASPGPGAAPTPSAPPTQLPGRRPARLSLLPSGMALVAMLLALVSIVVAVRASGRAGDAQDRLDAVEAAGGTSASATASATTRAGQTEQPEPTQVASTVGPEAPPTAPEARYASAYTGQTLQLQADCGGTLYVDLDVPRVVVSESSYDDLTYTQGCGGPSTFGLENRVSGSVVESASVQPWECADLINRSPIAPELEVPARKGVVMCVATSLSAAREQGNKQKMAVVEVTGEGKDGRIVIRVGAWDVPN